MLWNKNLVKVESKSKENQICLGLHATPATCILGPSLFI